MDARVSFSSSNYPIGLLTSGNSAIGRSDVRVFTNGSVFLEKDKKLPHQDGETVVPSMLSICGPKKHWIHPEHLMAWIRGARKSSRCRAAQNEGFKIIIVTGNKTEQHGVTILAWTADKNWQPGPGEDKDYQEGIKR